MCNRSIDYDLNARRQAYYWATSEWSAQQIEEAYRKSLGCMVTVVNRRLSRYQLVDVAAKLNLIPPIAEQCQHQCVLSDKSVHVMLTVLYIFHSMFHRERPEQEYA